MAKKTVTKPAPKAAAKDNPPPKKVGLSKTKPKSEAIPLGTPPAEVEKIKQQRRKSDSDVRTATANEERMRERARSIAAGLLVERDGLDPETALTVVESMGPEEIQALVSDAATTVLEKTSQPAEAPAPAAATKEDTQAGALFASDKVDEDNDDQPYIEFTDVESLLTSETFATLAAEVIDLATAKSGIERKYKAGKKSLATELREAGADRVIFAGIKLKRYKGSSSYLDPMKLLEKGVSVDIIKACYTTTEYEDVYIGIPRAPKEKKEE